MANIYKGTLGLIGNTPLVEVANIEKELGLKARVLVKLEYFNPAGSVKGLPEDFYTRADTSRCLCQYLRNYKKSHFLPKGRPHDQ